ncbi:hypothetical protein Hanom_Chr07g00620911 [Helianthus anomalus]
MRVETKRAKHHNFEGRFALEKHGRFVEAVQGAHVAPVPPVAHVSPVPPPINAQLLKSMMYSLCSRHNSSTTNQRTIVVRNPGPLTSENLVALLLSLQGGDRNPPSVSTVDVQETTTTPQVEMEIKSTADAAEESARKKQKTDSAIDDILFGPSTAPESTPIIDH